MSRNMKIEDNEQRYAMIADLIQVLDDGTTIGDILYAMAYVKNERDRKKNSYKPTGRPPGRPRKVIPMPDKTDTQVKV